MAKSIRRFGLTMCECGPYVGLDTLAIIFLVHASYGLPSLIYLIRQERKERRLRGVKVDNFIDELGLKVGRFFSKFRSIILVLFLYLIISLITFFALACSLYPDYRKAAFTAFEVATGGDPYNFSELNKFTYLWLWILSLHIISWLLVPVLMATAIDAAYRIWEERRVMLERDIMSKMDEVLNLVPDLTEGERERRKREALESLRWPKGKNS
jgi:hypothetical protein